MQQKQESVIVKSLQPLVNWQNNKEKISTVSTDLLNFIL